MGKPWHHQIELHLAEEMTLTNDNTIIFTHHLYLTKTLRAIIGRQYLVSLGHQHLTMAPKDAFFREILIGGKVKNRQND